MYHPAMATTALDPTRAARLFQALSDPTRLQLLETIRHGERCVCDLQGDLDAAQSRLSFHLRVLREAGLVTLRRVGRWSYYAIVPEALAEVHDVAVALQPAGRGRRGGGSGCCGIG
jgi:ArsR family transcriptional regulator, arsenate/arsenite/antimonite-responsive transcriptional repressor